jgi:ferredoxin
MTYRIMEDCIKCGGCVDECPQGAIVEGEGDEISRINPEKCDDCGICVTSFCCPAAAIIKDNN